MIASAVRDVLARSSISKMNPSEKRVFTEAIGVLAGELSLVNNIEFQGARQMIETRVTGVRKKKKQA
jgi:RNA polymerase-interacting CarD/CdnL/TRCF family regulator